MAWLSLVDPSERRFSLLGIGHDRLEERRHSNDPEYRLIRGSLVLETRLSPEVGPQELLGFDRVGKDSHSLSLRAIPGVGISVMQIENDAIAHAAVRHEASDRTEVLRITLVWDCARHWARLTVECPDEHKTISCDVKGMHPIRLDDLRDMFMGRGTRTISPDVSFAALSDQIEPIGPMPTLSPEALVATPKGYRPAGDLKRGDTVISFDGDVVPVLHSVTRTVPARGSFAPLRLRAPYFRLMQDVIVAPHQNLLITGADVEYLFGQEAVLAPAHHLVNGFSALWEPGSPTWIYTQLILPGHETLVVSGAPMDSLNIERIRRNRDYCAATLLRGIDRSSLPDHELSDLRVLKGFEAAQLVRERAA